MTIKIVRTTALLQAKVIFFLLSFHYYNTTLTNVYILQKMIMKIQRGRSTFKPKGKGLLWYLRRNTNTRKYRKSSKKREEE